MRYKIDLVMSPPDQNREMICCNYIVVGRKRAGWCGGNVNVRACYSGGNGGEWCRGKGKAIVLWL